MYDLHVEELIKLRESGRSYQWIANRYGVSRQCVYHKIKTYCQRKSADMRGRGFSVEQIKYVGIYEYFKAHPNETVTEFCRKTLNDDSTSVQKIKRLIIGGHDVYLSLKQYRAICAVVGKSFEETFREREI